tara:strand:- start:14841 stop:16874 length:2034 start_codon:yes stop_codon:yes gene_type:complete
MKKESYYLIFILISCVNDSTFSEPIVACADPNIKATHGIAQVKEMAGFGLVTFSDEIIIEGYVVSSDVSGNIYKTISLQDHFKNPTAAIRFAVDKTNMYSIYPLGRKVTVKLKGLSLGYTRGTLEIGKAVAAELQRIPSGEVSSHFFRSCETEEIIPKNVSLDKIDDTYLDMLLQIDDVQFKSEDLGKVYAELNSTKSIDRLLEQVSENCDMVSEITLRISGFSDFKSKELPEGKGGVTAVLTKYYSEYQLLLRTEEDVRFKEERCAVANTLAATISYRQIIDLYDDKLLEFGVNQLYIFEGFVVSSDEEGNFTKRLFIQEGTENSEGGFQVLVDEENLYEDFKIGDRVYIKLNNLYLDQIDGVYTIGFPDNESVQEIEEGFFKKYIINTQENSTIVPRKINLSEASVDLYQNTLVTLENVQIKSFDIGKAFAFYSGGDDGNRTLQTCDVPQEIVVETYGTASFSNEKFPVFKGSITGVLYSENTQLKIQIRTLDDVLMEDTYDVCEVVIPKVLIIEVADPQNNVSARFVELYNAGEKPFVLNEWKLNKYLNGSPEPSGSGIDLSGFVIASKGFLLVANTGFEVAFGIVPEIVSTSLSGNGDDVYALVDASGTIQDVFGEIGTDGTGTDWEYLDGKAIRNILIKEPNSIFDSNEWEIFSKPKDTEQLAPGNFTPNVR